MFKSGAIEVKKAELAQQKKDKGVENIFEAGSTRPDGEGNPSTSNTIVTTQAIPSTTAQKLYS